MLRGLKPVPWIGAVFVAAAIHGAEMRVAVTDRSIDRHCSQHAVVALSRNDGGESTPEEFRLPQGEQSFTITLADDAPRRVRVRSENCWSTTDIWAPPSGQDVRIELFSAATLQGTLSTDAAKPPVALSASAFRIVEDGRTAKASPDAEPLDCSLDLPRWRCVVPAQLAIDVRLEPQGFGSTFLWNVLARPGEQRDAGTQKLVAGASLAGWLQDPDGLPLPGAVVTLAPLQPEHPEGARAAAAEQRATSNARGFFQFNGVPAGDYRLVSRAPRFAPVVVPSVTIRPTLAMTWPRALRHADPITLNVTVDPPASPDGAVWSLTVKELIPLRPAVPPESVALSRQEDGTWSARGLRPDRYELLVKGNNDFVVERMLVDLSDGAPAILNVSVRPLTVSGVLLTGDEPLAGADLELTNSQGERSSATSDEEGRFQVFFPSPGRWQVLVFPYSRRNRTQIRAKPVEVSAENAAELKIVLPAGRIRGTVVTQDGKPAQAGVHVFRDGAMAAQQTTDPEGKFDLAGLSEGSYTVSATAKEGTTAAPSAARVDEDHPTDLKLVIEPYRIVRATVLTPSGQPASGTIVRISTDDGASWVDEVIDWNGVFEYPIAAGIDRVALLVVSPSYPTAMVQVPVQQARQPPLKIQLLPIGGMVSVTTPRVWVLRQNFRTPFGVLLPPFELGPTSRAHLEPGNYSVCREPKIDTTCRQIQVSPGTSTTVAIPTDQEKGNAR